jgi:excisionase family DNA binding protein
VEANNEIGVEALLTPQQAAGVLGISPRTLGGWVRAGKISVVKVGRLHKFRPAALRQWIEAREHLAVTGGRERE